MSAAYAQDINESSPAFAWVHQPSARLTAELRHWRLTFEPGEPQSEAEKGVFPSFASESIEGTARLVSDLTPAPSINLTPVAKRIRYVPQGDGHTDPDDKDVTRNVIETLRSPEIVKLIETQRVNNTGLDVEKDFAVALVQDFDIALRAGKKEHVWSINWRIDRRTQADYAGYEAWGLFTRENGALHPFYLVARESQVEAPSVSYYYILAIGDLNGDGIDEMVAREMGFEKDQDDLELWSWERGAPVTIYRMPWP